MIAELLYNLSILLSFADILAIPVGLLLAYSGWSTTGVALPMNIGTIPGSSTPMMIGGIILSIVALIAIKPLHEMRIFYRSKAEYDEFGRSKSKGSYERLSKKERDAIDLQTTADMERIVSSEVLKKITKEGSKNPDSDMNELIGLQPVKDKMHEMVARMEFEAEDAKDKKKKKKKKNATTLEETSFSGRHMVFTGSPGTGKTTIARIMTGFLYKYGYIKENKCVEVDGNFLKAGEYTEQKVKLVVQRAFGGVLFIDEAYALMYGAGAADAIATLIKQMEDNRGRFIVILAGYTNEMRELLYMLGQTIRVCAIECPGALLILYPGRSAAHRTDVRYLNIAAPCKIPGNLRDYHVGLIDLYGVSYAKLKIFHYIDVVY